jgi:hypothetical protein
MNFLFFRGLLQHSKYLIIYIYKDHFIFFGATKQKVEFFFGYNIGNDIAKNRLHN